MLRSYRSGDVVAYRGLHAGKFERLEEGFLGISACPLIQGHSFHPISG